MGKTYQNHRWHEQIKIETIISLKNTFTTLLVKHDKSVLIIFSNLAVTFMLSIRLLLTCAFLSFDRQKFRKKKGGIKVHTLYNVETQIPAFFRITEASVHDSKSYD